MSYIQYELFPDILVGNDVDALDTRLRHNKDNVFGLQYCSNAIYAGKYGIPMIKSYVDEVPSNFITFSEIGTSSDYFSGVACFDKDRKLEALWNNPGRYIKTLSKFTCISEPDFSLKIGEPLAVQIANTYRNHAIAYYMQENALKVLPSMSWGNTESYDFCFDGHSKGGAVIVSTIGTLRDERSSMYFRCGFNEMLKRICPDHVVIYGDVNEQVKSILPDQLSVSYICHNRFKRARNYGSKRSI